MCTCKHIVLRVASAADEFYYCSVLKLAANIPINYCNKIKALCIINSYVLIDAYRVFEVFMIIIKQAKVFINES